MAPLGSSCLCGLSILPTAGLWPWVLGILTLPLAPDIVPCCLQTEQPLPGCCWCGKAACVLPPRYSCASWQLSRGSRVCIWRQPGRKSALNRSILKISLANTYIHIARDTLRKNKSRSPCKNSPDYPRAVLKQVSTWEWAKINVAIYLNRDLRTVCRIYALWTQILESVLLY